MIPLIIVTFLTVLLPTMILTYLLSLVPRLKRNPKVTYGISAVFVAVVTLVLSALGGTWDILARETAGFFVLGVLALDYRRTVSMRDIGTH